jgi:hypothetical protein
MWCTCEKSHYTTKQNYGFPESLETVLASNKVTWCACCQYSNPYLNWGYQLLWNLALNSF